MLPISTAILGQIRHQLWLDHIEIVEEFEKGNLYLIAIRPSVLTCYEVANISRICPIGVMNLYVDGNLELCISIAKDC